MIIFVNGKKIGKWIVNKYGKQQITIPKNLVYDNYIRISFELPDAISPIESGISDDLRILGIAIKEMTISETNPTLNF